jgi:hypothetical protein
MVTWAPACWARIAEVIPSAPQPTTATSRGLLAMALATAMVPEPQDSDQPLPPCP